MGSLQIVNDIEDKFKKNHLYFSPIKGFDVMAAMEDASVGANATKISSQFLAYGIYGYFDDKKVNTTFVLKRLDKDGDHKFQYKYLYRPRNKEIIRLESSMLEKKQIDDSKDGFYWCRCEHFSVESVKTKAGIRNCTSKDYYDLFLDHVVNFYGNDLSLEKWRSIKKYIGAVEFDPQSLQEENDIRKVFNQYFTGDLLNNIIQSDYVKNHIKNCII